MPEPEAGETAVSQAGSLDDKRAPGHKVTDMHDDLAVKLADATAVVACFLAAQRADLEAAVIRGGWDRGAGRCAAPLGSGPRLADRPQRPRRVRSQRCDQPGDHRVGGHRAGDLGQRPDVIGDACGHRQGDRPARP